MGGEVGGWVLLLHGCGHGWARRRAGRQVGRRGRPLLIALAGLHSTAAANSRCPSCSSKFGALPGTHRHKQTTSSCPPFCSAGHADAACRVPPPAVCPPVERLCGKRGRGSGGPGGELFAVLPPCRRTATAWREGRLPCLPACLHACSCWACTTACCHLACAQC